MAKKIFFTLIYIFLKIIYKISFKFNNYDFYDFISFYLVGSNHPKRLDLVKSKLTKKEDWTNKLFLFKEIDNNKTIIFFGDSHVEYFSRVIYKKENFLPKKIYSLWLGPRTVIGLNSSDNLTKLRQKINFINSLKLKNFTLILSLGSIDIRCLFYEFFLRKLVNKNEEIYSLFERNLMLFIDELKQIKNKHSCFFMGLFNSKDKGFETLDINELIKYKDENNYPTLGNFSKRNEWTRYINELIKETSKKNSINVIPIENFTNNLSSNEILEDNIHLVSEKVYKHIYNSLR